MFRRVALVSFICLLAVAVIGCGKQSDKEGGKNAADNGAAATKPQQTWRFAIEEVEGSVQDHYAQKFAQLIQEKTGGRIKVDVYPYGSLGSSSQVTEQVQSGAIQFAFASPGHLGSVIPEVQVFTLNFLFSDDDKVNEEVLSDSPELYKALDEAYREKSLHILDAIQEGWMVWTANKPIRTPSDFNGVKIRVMNSPLLLDTYEAYGANPTPMDYSEVYSGLQLGIIDAQVNPVFAIQEMSFYEVQKDMIFAHQLPFMATVVTNPKFFDGLSDDLRGKVNEAVGELHEYIYGVQQKLNEDRLATIKKNSNINIVKLTDDQRAQFRKASMPVRDKYKDLAGERGAKILGIVEKRVKEVESETGKD